MKAQEIVTTESQLALLRKGNKQELELKLGELSIPCRLMSAVDETAIIRKAKGAALRLAPDGNITQVEESMEIMKCMLEAACTVNNTPHVNRKFLDALTSPELEALYDQYMTLCKTSNPEFESLTHEQIGELISDVKKKKVSSSDLYTWQRAAIGKFFLDHILPAVSVPGS